MIDLLIKSILNMRIYNLIVRYIVLAFRICFCYEVILIISFLVCVELEDKEKTPIEWTFTQVKTGQCLGLNGLIFLGRYSFHASNFCMCDEVLLYPL